MLANAILIEMEDSSPLIWRRVIVPAGATFRQLHEIIQNTTNFLSGYPDNNYHRYQFNLNNLTVSEDEDGAAEHRHFVENVTFYNERLKTMKPEFVEFERNHQERLARPIEMSRETLIDAYLKDEESFTYDYDFGEGWTFKITFEGHISDYPYDFPELTEGEETAPPEDCGGMSGFERFKEAYYNPLNKEHRNMVEWAESQYYLEFSPNLVNRLLRFITIE